MYCVFLWYDVSGESYTELLGVFPDQSIAYQFCVSYAMFHMISIDKLEIASDETVSLENFVDEVLSR